MADLGFGPGLAANPLLWVCAGWHPATDLVVHPPQVSGVGAQPGFYVLAPTQALFVCAPRQPGLLSGCTPTLGFGCGPQATDWGTRPLGHFGSCAQAAGPLIRACAHLDFQL